MATWQRGDLVRFNHERNGGPVHRVASVQHDGMIEMEDVGGYFAPHLFTLADDIGGIPPSPEAMSALPTPQQDCAVASILLALQPFTDAEALSIATCVLASVIEHASTAKTAPIPPGLGTAYARLANAVGTTLSNPAASARCRRLKFRNP